MNLIKKIYSLFKKFLKKEDIKMLNQPIVKDLNRDKNKFIDSLKVNIVKNKKKVETLTCFGDGLGIQKKITY